MRNAHTRSQDEAYIVHYGRTPFSRSRPNDPERDVFNGKRMDTALSELMIKAVADLGIEASEIDNVIVGSAYQRDENWTYGGRHPILLSNFPVAIPSMAVDKACASSLNGASIGAMEIMLGFSDTVLAGGIEHMTHVPRLSNKLCEPLLDTEKYPEIHMKDAYNMGITAEKLARISKISKGEMDEFALRSHMLASRADDDGFLSGEIMPVAVKVNGETVTIDRDQSIRKDTTLEKIQNLPPAFSSDGVITAGNSSPLNAGASLVALMSGEKVKEESITPMARVVSIGKAGVPPDLMGLGPIPASVSAAKNAGISIDDIDIWEINEAFAVVVLNTIKELNIDPSRVNVKGGAIAIGHPLGATGARMLGTASRILRETGKDTAMVTLCAGGGQGFSIVIERV